MSDFAQLRGFFLRAPKPSVVRTVKGDEVNDFQIDESTNFARLAETVDALEVDRVECYDDDGQILRAEKPKRRPQAMSKGMPDVIAQDPEAARIAHFADLLHRAYEQSTQLAFEKLVEMFQMQSQQVQSMTARIERAERAYIGKLAENARLKFGGTGQPEEEDEGFGLDMFEAFMGGLGVKKGGRPRKVPAPEPETEEEPADD